MSKRKVIGFGIAGILLLAGISGAGNNKSTTSLDSNKKPLTTQPVKNDTVQPAANVKPACDGTSITSNCTAEGVSYKTYVYHPAVAEKSHVDTTTTYEKKVTGTCTLCNDGTYSPSCATGRGACSHHGGVQQWNAPEYTSVPVTNSRTVVDAPAQAAFYEKINAE